MAWAPDCAQRNGKYYFYFPVEQSKIGVTVRDNPCGPFTDPLDSALIHIDSEGVVCNRDFIDPAVFVDDDGQAYLYMGQWVVNAIKLNEDMISYDGEVYLLEGTDDFFEAVWMQFLWDARKMCMLWEPPIRGMPKTIMWPGITAFICPCLVRILRRGKEDTPKCG